MGSQLHMADGVREFAISMPRNIAVEDGSRQLTFSALDDRSNRLATGLLERGMKPGERVAVLSGNRLEYFEIATALAKAGIVMVPLNPRNAVRDNEFIVEHSQARGVILESDLAGQLGSLVDQIEFGLSLGGDVMEDYDDFIMGYSPTDPRVEVLELDDFCIIYTSGTTGKPKGVRLSHRARVLAGFATAVEYGLGPGRRTMAVAPMYHGAGFSFAYAGPQFGGSTAVLKSWDPEQFLSTCASSRAQSVFLVPTHAMQIREVVQDPCAAYDLTSLETFYFNAAALPVELNKWVHHAFPGVGVHELYGSTECFVVTDLRPPDSLRKAGSVGHPWFMNQVELIGDDGQRVPPGTPGELFARSTMLMSGYLGDDESTRKATSDRGFISVGDIATQDSEGFISIVDRKTDLIISGGVNIYPREIEEAISSHPSVMEASVVGVPDPVYGERIAAYVVASRDSTLDLAAVRESLVGELASHKIPRDWQIIDELPRNPGGKVLKRQLRDGHDNGTRPGTQ